LMHAALTPLDFDLALSDLDYLLELRHAGTDVECTNSSTCVCGARDFHYAGSGSPWPGSLMCTRCGCVQNPLAPVFFETMYGRSASWRSSNYKRIHHFHERLSQLVLAETNIPKQDMLCIARTLCANGPITLTKDSVRKVLRPLKMQRYIERWLQIIYRLTGERPPHISDMMVMQLDALFVELQRPFDVMKQDGRKNFLNYNYVLRRLFQQVGCSKFCVFFPLIKSEAKLHILDETWEKMAKSLNWKVEPLCRSAPFEALLSDPLAALGALELSAEDSAPPELRTARMRMECRMLDRFHAARAPLERQLLHSAQPALRSQKAVSKRLRLQCKRAKLCQ
jgi:hypothetical protein